MRHIQVRTNYSGKAREEEKLLRECIAKQSTDSGKSNLPVNKHLVIPNGTTGERNRFPLKTASKSSDQADDVLAIVTPDGDRPHVAAWRSYPLSGDERARFLALLPSLTTYDLALEAANRLMAEPLATNFPTDTHPTASKGKGREPRGSQLKPADMYLSDVRNCGRIFSTATALVLRPANLPKPSVLRLVDKNFRRVTFDIHSDTVRKANIE